MGLGLPQLVEAGSDAELPIGGAMQDSFELAAGTSSASDSECAVTPRVAGRLLVAVAPLACCMSLAGRTGGRTPGSSNPWKRTDFFGILVVVLLVL